MTQDKPDVVEAGGVLLKSAGPSLAEETIALLQVGRQEQVPVLILKPKLSESERQSGQVERKPALIFLHWTGADKEMMRPHMQVGTASCTKSVPAAPLFFLFFLFFSACWWMSEGGESCIHE